MSDKCIIHGCPNRKNQGSFIGDICLPCSNMLVSGDPKFGVTFVHKMRDHNKELEAKLAKAVGLLEAWVNVATHCTIEDGVCCCGDNMDTHAEPMDCGHSPVDHGAYIAMGLAEETETTLAELTGESHE